MGHLGSQRAIARAMASRIVMTELVLVLYLACEGVKCTADTTCSYLGQCVPAQVDPAACATPDGCSLPGEPPFVPGVAAAADAGSDETSAAVADVANDADAGPTGPELQSDSLASAHRSLNRELRATHPRVAPATSLRSIPGLLRMKAEGGTEPRCA